ncbi:unnamed protein product [Arctia plantaginis]|uniref:Uncharacterized protein n=1 Tax=Arctia plantaginis TaxID=874455 RepID=A0A8S1AHA7_ARCPL|nr:unnamed protein product [Arctia plantaginis]
MTRKRRLQVELGGELDYDGENNILPPYCPAPGREDATSYVMILEHNSLLIHIHQSIYTGEVSKENRESLVQLNTLDVLEEYGVEINEEKDERPFYKRSIQLLEDVEALEYIINIVKQELSDEEINSIYLEGDSQLSEVVPYSGQHLALLDVENNERQDSNNNSMSDQDVEVISPPMVIEDVVDTTPDKQEETVADEGINKTRTDDNTAETVTVKRLTVEDMIGYSGGLRVYERYEGKVMEERMNKIPYMINLSHVDQIQTMLNTHVDQKETMLG